MSINIAKIGKSDYIKMALCFIVPIMILLMPEGDVLTRNAKFFLAITVWFLMWAAFEVTNLLIPALLYPALMVFFKVTTIQTAYSSWQSLIPPTIIAAFIISYVLDECGLLKRICYWVVKTCGGSFKRTMVALYVACLAVSAVTFANAEVIIATFCFGLCNAFGLAKTKEAAIIMMVGMLAASTSRAFIYYPLFMGSILGSTAVVDPTFEITATSLLMSNWPMIIFALLFIALMFVGSKKNGVGASISERGVDYFQNEYKQLGTMTSEEKKAAVITVLLMVLVIAAPFAGVNCMFAFIFIAALMYLPGINLGTASVITKVPLGTLIFVASCMGIGAVCNEVGLTAQLAAVLTALLGGVNVFGTLMVVLGFGVLANFAMTPLSMFAAFGGPLLSMAVSLGISPESILFTFLFSGDMVFLPYEFVSYLIFFSFGMITTGQFVKYHAMKNVATVVFFVVVMLPYWHIIGLI